MKVFSFSKLSLVLLGLGGVLTLAPSSRAQAEVAPDHFDGTDSWEVAAKASAPKAKPQSSSAPVTARSNKPSTPAVQTVAARNPVLPRRSDATAAKKRKAAAPKSSN